MAPPKGFRHSLYSIELIRKKKLGKKRGHMPLETKEKIRKKKLGQKYSPEHCANISAGLERYYIEREYSIDDEPIDDEPIDDEYDPYEYLYNNC